MLNKKPAELQTPLYELVASGYMYTEIHRLREQITNSIPRDIPGTIMLSSPRDSSGTTLFISLLGVNFAKFTSMNVLLLDLNMRNPHLHEAFQLSNNSGFTEIARGESQIKDSVQKTSFDRLECLTTGKITLDSSLDTNRASLEEFMQNLKGYYDLVICDTSPLLTQNRNNIDSSMLSLICDSCFIIVRDKLTTKKELQTAVETIPEYEEKLHGIIYNLYH